MMLDVSRRLIVIIGGGAVAARKARGLIDAGASRVRAVAPQFADDFPDGIERLTELYRPDHLADAALVFAATNDASVNAQVVHDAHARNLLVNRADANDDDADSDFSTPAKFTQGPVTVTVSAAGNPALAAVIRDGLRWRFDKRWAVMAEAMQTLRPRILAARELSGEQRSAIFRELASDDALYLVARDGVDALSAWVIQRHPELR
jgi:precorrin-2 dehydrogenase/sirohydrochlorin ferrochelatase